MVEIALYIKTDDGKEIKINSWAQMKENSLEILSMVHHDAILEITFLQY